MTIPQAPRWLIQTQDGWLHGYYSKEILLCDLAINSGEAVSIFALEQGVTTKYVPISREMLTAGDEAEDEESEAEEACELEAI